MNKKLSLNFPIVNIFTLIIFNIFLLGLVYGLVLVNIFIFLLLIIFLISIKQKKIYLVDNIDFSIKLQIIFCLYIIFNSFFINSDIDNFYKAIFYFRFFLIAFVISKILEFKNKTLDYIAVCFLFFSIFLSIDIFYQYLTGRDFFGFAPGICSYPNGSYLIDPRSCERFSGFFASELIAGNFLSTYGIFSLFIFISKFENLKYSQIFSSVCFIIIIFAVILSGERNAILSLLIIFSFNLFFNKKYRKKLLFIFSFFLIIFSFLFFNVDQIKYRYFTWPIDHISSKESDGIKKIFDTSWGSHYVTAYEIYKNNKLFGSGFKSFRNECKKNDYDYKKLNQKFNLNLKVSGCSSHPHHLYLEVLSELGIVGFTIFLVVLYFTIFHPFFKNFSLFIRNKEIIILLSIVLTFIFPLKPTGSFSASVFSTNMWFFIGFYLYFIRELNYKKKIKK